MATMACSDHEINVLCPDSDDDGSDDSDLSVFEQVQELSGSCQDVQTWAKGV